VLRIHQRHPDAVLREHIVKSDPIHPGRLQRHGIDAAGPQPLGHPHQIGGPAAELLHGLGIAAGGHRDEVRFIADVDAASVGMNDGESGVRQGQLPP